MTRSGHNVFVKDSDKKEPRLSYCRLCEEKHGKFNKLVPRLINNIPDDKFRVCSFCGELYPIYEIKYASLYEPKGTLNSSGNPFDSGTKVKAVRKKRLAPSKKVEGIEKIHIDKLGGRDDIELEEMLSSKSRPATLNFISDTIVEDSDSDPEGYY